MTKPLFIILLLFLISCSENIEQKKRLKPVESIAVPQLDSSVISTRLDINKLTKLIDTIFDIDSIFLVPEREIWKRDFFQFTDSSYVVKFYRYLTFSLIEYSTDSMAFNEFEKIKDITNALKLRKGPPSRYFRLIRKGGVTIIWVKNFIVVHSLRCNMFLEDYEKDKRFVTQLELMSEGSDWIRSYCGWGKFESK